MTTISSNEIHAALGDLGLPTGARILMHSSLSSFGHVDGGADAVIDAVLKAVDSSGTVVVPTLTATALHSPNDPPVFDPVNSACWTGRIPETFRKRPEAIRSLHPTHSVAAIGPDAEELTSDHTFSISPCDEKSPFGKLAQLENGYVLLVGVGYDSVTTFHHVEELAAADYHMQKGFTKATLVIDGENIERHYMLHQWGTARDFNIMQPLFIERGVQKMTRIGDSEVRLLHAPSIRQITLECLRSDSRILCKD
ncbi:MAG: AAC(3) family N-acetyltransferase [Chloroflexi bacterium]|jgi:aminoglycoside 3-N-acetyltransferase|nr:AAC(3) family N-acetyltransferase [Chloroflexota bacterium]